MLSDLEPLELLLWEGRLWKPIFESMPKLGNAVDRSRPFTLIGRSQRRWAQRPILVCVTSEPIDVVRLRI